MGQQHLSNTIYQKPFAKETRSDILQGQALIRGVKQLRRCLVMLNNFEKFSFPSIEKRWTKDKETDSKLFHLEQSRLRDQYDWSVPQIRLLKIDLEIRDCSGWYSLADRQKRK